MLGCLVLQDWSYNKDRRLIVRYNQVFSLVSRLRENWTLILFTRLKCLTGTSLVSLSVMLALEMEFYRQWGLIAYKCFATNEYGRAVCTVNLNIIQGRK